MENLTVKVYGSGCKGCKTLHQNVIDALAEMNLAADVEYITDMQKIMETGVMSLPALAVNDKIVSFGKVLSVADVKKFLGERI
ncbi:MAG: TM0996/MTH895 family glutaredoxin-like protein [Treponema sp.]|nr:TM0996/MTH895 family glutaredoxin-like protein [Treponema sp.]